jgi:hypothetical protein
MLPGSITSAGSNISFSLEAYSNFKLIVHFRKMIKSLSRSERRLTHLGTTQTTTSFPSGTMETIPTPPLAGSSSSHTPAMCAECHTHPSKYKCPRCSHPTCSLACSKSHKAATECSGERDKTKKILLKDYGYGAMMDDYKWLEEGRRRVEGWGKEIVEKRLVTGDLLGIGGGVEASGGRGGRGGRGRGAGGGTAGRGDSVAGREGSRGRGRGGKATPYDRSEHNNNSNNDRGRGRGRGRGGTNSNGRGRGTARGSAGNSREGHQEANVNPEINPEFGNSTADNTPQLPTNTEEHQPNKTNESLEDSSSNIPTPSVEASSTTTPTSTPGIPKPALIPIYAQTVPLPLKLRTTGSTLGNNPASTPLVNPVAAEGGKTIGLGLGYGSGSDEDD